MHKTGAKLSKGLAPVLLIYLRWCAKAVRIAWAYPNPVTHAVFAGFQATHKKQANVSSESFFCHDLFRYYG